MRGSLPERSSKCAATAPSRRKLLMFRPSSMRKARARLGVTATGSAAWASAADISNMQRSDRTGGIFNTSCET